MTMRARARNFYIGFALLLTAVTSRADTLHLADGASIDGTVRKVNDNCVAIASGNGEIVYQLSEIARIEKNDKKGTLDLAVEHPAAIRHEQELERRTGLKAEQRERVLALVDRLAAEDTNERNQAMRQLVALQQKFDVFRFLKESRMGFGARVLPGVLEVMLALNRAESKPIIIETLGNPVPLLRAATLELAGRAKGVIGAETVARGLADVDLDVRIAAAKALADLQAKEATPALIALLSDTQARMRNAARASLSRLWSRSDAVVQYETPEEWTTFWETSRGAVGKPIELSSLDPLHVQAPETYVLVHE